MGSSSCFTCYTCLLTAFKTPLLQLLPGKAQAQTAQGPLTHLTILQEFSPGAKPPSGPRAKTVMRGRTLAVSCLPFMVSFATTMYRTTRTLGVGAVVMGFWTS